MGSDELAKWCLFGILSNSFEKCRNQELPLTDCTGRAFFVGMGIGCFVSFQQYMWQKMRQTIQDTVAEAVTEALRDFFNNRDRLNPPHNDDAPNHSNENQDDDENEGYDKDGINGNGNEGENDDGEEDDDSNADDDDDEATGAVGGVAINAEAHHHTAEEETIVFNYPSNPEHTMEEMPRKHSDDGYCGDKQLMPEMRPTYIVDGSCKQPIGNGKAEGKVSDGLRKELDSHDEALKMSDMMASLTLGEIGSSVAVSSFLDRGCLCKSHDSNFRSVENS